MKNNIVGAGLREARENKELSVSEVSENLISKGFKASTKTIYSWECGNSQPTPDAFLFLCELYGVTDILNTFGYRKLDEVTELNIKEYPIMSKYRRLNDSGKEYIDAKLDFALSQEKYKTKTPLLTEQAETLDDVDDCVDVSYAAYGGESGTFQITRKEYEEGKKLYDAYDYRTDK